MKMTETESEQVFVDALTVAPDTVRGDIFRTLKALPPEGQRQEAEKWSYFARKALRNVARRIREVEEDRKLHADVDPRELHWNDGRRRHDIATDTLLDLERSKTELENLLDWLELQAKRIAPAQLEAKAPQKKDKGPKEPTARQWAMYYYFLHLATRRSFDDHPEGRLAGIREAAEKHRKSADNLRKEYDKIGSLRVITEQTERDFLVAIDLLSGNQLAQDYARHDLERLRRKTG